MKFITVRDLRTSPAKVWEELPKEQEMVITNNGKPIALLTPLSDSTLEETVSAVRRARAANAVRQLQLIALKSGASSLTDEDVQVEIRAVRSTKRNR